MVRGIHYSSCYSDVIMTTIASQITSLTVVYSIVYSGTGQRKHQSSASLAFVRGSHRDRWIPRTKGQLRGKCFHLMTSSWNDWIWCHLSSWGDNFLSRQYTWYWSLNDKLMGMFYCLFYNLQIQLNIIHEVFATKHEMSRLFANNVIRCKQSEWKMWFWIRNL